MERDGIANFFLGLGIGVGLGMLFAPKSGDETRDLLMSKADEGKEYLKKQTQTWKDIRCSTEWTWYVGSARPRGS